MTPTQVCEEMLRTGRTRWLNFSVMPKDEYVARMIMLGHPKDQVEHTKTLTRFDQRLGWAYSVYAGTKYGSDPKWIEFPIWYGHVKVSKGWSPWGYGSHYPIYTFRFDGPDGFEWAATAWGNGFVRARRYLRQHPREHHKAGVIIARSELTQECDYGELRDY